MPKQITLGTAPSGKMLLRVESNVDAESYFFKHEGGTVEFWYQHLANPKWYDPKIFNHEEVKVTRKKHPSELKKARKVSK